MESPLSFFACIGTMNHPSPDLPATLSPSDGEREGVRGRFMESEHLQKLDASWDLEPVGIPLSRPSGTFSPTGGEGRDEGVRFMGRVREGFHDGGGIQRRPASGASPQRCLIRLAYFCRSLPLWSSPFVLLLM